ncbi:uncharacterized protein RJT20DRAFT_124603 [Scheffersomyces xylosifermentans]|uniref:uncharacterized protein n=1 Tax=Scheffersomyces xylosifermentans TaxID=1304137 RepID=UPI00315D1C69
MYFRRAFSSINRLQFQKETAAQFIKSTKTASSAATPVAAARNGTKWQPTNGNSFRSFAEYRLKITNQSPLAVRSGNFISVRTH